VTEDSARSIQHVAIDDATSIAFQKGGARNLAVGTSSGKTHIWDTQCYNSIKTYGSSSSGVKLVDFNTKNTYLAAALENGDVGIYDITTNSLLSAVNVPHSKNISSLRFHKEFRSILGIATDDGSILLKDLSSGKDKMFLNNAHAAPITGIAFSPINKNVLLSCSNDKKMHIHDIRLQTIVSTINSDKFLTCVDINNVGIKVAMGSNTGNVLAYLRSTQFQKTI
jgi:protein NEDD1